MPWGELAALATAVCWSFTAIFFSISGRRIGSDVVNRSRLLFAFVLLLIAHRLLEGVFFPQQVEPFRWGWLALSSFLGLVLGDAFLFRALVEIGPRLSMLMMSTVPIISTLFGWLLFGEVISPLELVGVLLAVGGVAWVVTEGRGESSVADRRAYHRGLLFALLGALGQVANLVTARYALVDDFPAISATVIRILVAIIILWALAGLRGQISYTFRQWRDKQALRALIAGATFGPFLGIWFSLIAVQNARLGIASTLMALPPILLIPLEYLIYRRRISRRGMTGTAVAMVGVALLFI
ncbi:MAG: DMT family transporter [Candidatus Promineofilum sp.]|nr:DMT family transporter [Promineifilum sp.]